MNTLHSFLTERGYTRTKLHLTKTNHFEIRATINGVKGLFILDTGASNSCVGFESVDHFNLDTEDSEIKAAGAGATDMETKLSEKNKIKIGKWRNDKLALILFNLTHVNTALVKHKSKPVDGIIGADILKKGKAIIDYNRKYLYLKLN
jgi:predicted aspartyl protease